MWFSEKSVAFIALLLSTLASGAHFSILDESQPSEVCLDFGKLVLPAYGYLESCPGRVILQIICFCYG